jgi:hypothetical protein
MQVSQHFENWDNFVNKCSVCLHAVDGKGTILWANDLELKAMGYEPDEYIGRFIGDFHLDEDVIQDILARLGKSCWRICYLCPRSGGPKGSARGAEGADHSRRSRRVRTRACPGAHKHWSIPGRAVGFRCVISTSQRMTTGDRGWKFEGGRHANHS